MNPPGRSQSWKPARMQERRDRLDRRPQVQSTRPDSSLQALQLIETVPDTGPLTIALVTHPFGSAMSPEEVMDARVQWAVSVRYTVVTRDVPRQFAPYNAIIRVLGTEDLRTDYLAVLLDEGHDSV